MFIAHFTERPYQDPESGYFGATGKSIKDLTLSNEIYDPELGADLYNRYLDERLYAEEMGFDGLMLNEHHSTPFCMGGAMNIEAAILARMTKRAKIVLLGNIIPIWDDPLWLVEQLAIIDMISRGRLVSGWVRGTGRESVSHNAPPPYNWERFQEAHDFIVKAWTTPGPFRWEGKHYHYRYVNPWARTVPEAASSNLAARCGKPRFTPVGSAQSHPVHHAGDRDGAHQAGVPALPRDRRGRGATSPVRRTSATCGRYMWTRRKSSRSRPRASMCKVPATPSSRATRARPIQHFWGCRA